MTWWVSIPTYAWFHRHSFECFHWNFSRLDWFTVASALDEPETVYRIMMFAFLISAVAYAFLFSFCYEMSQTEFTTADIFIEKLVAKHAVFLRGVNPEIGPKTAQTKVRKVFEQRFGKGKVIACHAYKISSLARKLYQQIKAFKYKLDELNEKSQDKQERAYKRRKSSRHEMDANEYYQQKLNKAVKGWKECLASHNR